MQNLPVTATSPVIQPQAQASAADSAPQGAESFSNVLARQRASSAESKQPEVKQVQSGARQGAASASNEAPAATEANVQDAAAGQVATAGVSSADLLTSLLPGIATDKSTAAGENAVAQTASPDAAAALPGDMLAMLMPANMAGKTSVSGDKVSGDAVAATDKKGRLQQVDAGALGKARPGQAAEIAADAKQTQAQASIKLDDKAGGAAGVTASKDKEFAAALETATRAGSKSVQLEADAAKLNLQKDASGVMNSLAQNGAVTSVSQNGNVQVAQIAVNTPVTDRAWGEEFNQKITWMASQQQQTAELHLNPPNLGPLDVVLNVNGDQATAMFASPHAAVRDAIEQALPKLRDMMADNGIMLGNATVSDQSPKDQQPGQASGQRDGGKSSGTADGIATTAGTLTAGVAAPARRHLGMVDTFA